MSTAQPQSRPSSTAIQVEIWEPACGGYLWGLYSPRGHLLAEAGWPLDSEARAIADAHIASRQIERHAS